ncbi:MAG: DUF1559 domain-containing protein [Pirellulales bacterium]|nr:DUF1559 domain-containing protein [Pirellulales bacterium]
MELLVVIAIIGILIALLLPAVQAAREAARRVECVNHIKQLATATLQHESTHKFFPTGGWGWIWIGDPEMGFSKRQPGGWTFNILPFLEMQQVYKMGANPNAAAKRKALRQMYETPLSVYNCPTRRAAQPYKYILPDMNPAQYEHPNAVARGDYAMNCGDQLYNQYWGPSSRSEGLNPAYAWPDTETISPSNPWYSSGISYLRSTIKVKQVKDGLNHTYLIGEKYLSPDHYADGLDGADNSGLHTGYENDNYRATYYPPKRDRYGVEDWYLFGSAHPDVWNVALCDGSVHSVNYSIDPIIHKCLGSRSRTNPNDPVVFSMEDFN